MIGERVFKFSAIAVFTASLLLTASGLTGCGPRKSEEPSKVATKPARDKLRTRNDDTLHGKLAGDSFTISSPLIHQVTVPRADIKEIAFDGEQDSIRTRRGDLLRGRLSTTRFQFEASVGVKREFKRSELKWIRLDG